MNGPLERSIFIASSTEATPLAKTVAQHLARAGYRPRRWWEDFPLGSITIDRLNEIADDIDGAVLLFTADDRTWYRGASFGSPRDNVILEYGLFLGSVGRERAVVVTGNDTLRPTDLSGLNYLPLAPDATSVAERIVQHFDEIFRRHPIVATGVVPWTADPSTIRKQTEDPPPAEWKERLLYFGTEGAKAWRHFFADPTYSKRIADSGAEQLRLRALKGHRYRTFVSLGPGDGQPDINLVLALRHADPWLEYIPVDISDGLLQMSATALSEHVPVPLGILADFEERLTFIRRQVESYSWSPYLFSLIGGTFGNLDRQEFDFLHALNAQLEKGDAIILDAALAREGVSEALVGARDPKTFRSGKRRFLSTGISRRTGESVERILESFVDRVGVRDGESQVPGTTSLTTFDREHNQDIGTVRYYKWESLVDWITSEIGLEITFKDTIERGTGLGYGVIVAQRPENA